jgi:hypothetical protein
MERLAAPLEMLPPHLCMAYVEWLLGEVAACLVREDPGISQQEAERCLDRFADKLLKAAGLADESSRPSWAVNIRGTA